VLADPPRSVDGKNHAWDLDIRDRFRLFPLVSLRLCERLFFLPHVLATFSVFI